MKWHPFSERFPLLEGEEWETFKASILRTKGNTVPIICRRLDDGTLQGIDGRNRDRACEELGLQCSMEEKILEDDEVKDFILVRNIHRRHMTRELRQSIVLELRGDGKSTRQIAEALGVSSMTVHRDIQQVSPGVTFVTPGAPNSGGKNLPPCTSTERNGVHAPPEAEVMDVEAGCTKDEAAALTETGLPTEAKPIEKVTGKDGKKYPAKKPTLDREPGDDTELEENEKKKPKPGKVLFDWKPFDAALGSLVRSIDTLYRNYGQTRENGSIREDDRHREMTNTLKNFRQLFKHRYKQLTNQESPND